MVEGKFRGRRRVPLQDLVMRPRGLVPDVAEVKTHVVPLLLGLDLLPVQMHLHADR